MFVTAHADWWPGWKAAISQFVVEHLILYEHNFTTWLRAHMLSAILVDRVMLKVYAKYLKGKMIYAGGNIFTGNK